jgi:hypothetical protein
MLCELGNWERRPGNRCDPFLFGGLLAAFSICWALGQSARFANVANIQAYTCICICVCLQNLGYSMAYTRIPLAPPMVASLHSTSN